MPQIKSVLSAANEVKLIKLKPTHKAIVDNFTKQLLALQHKAHEPRSFEFTVKNMREQLQQLSQFLQKMKLGFSPLKAYRRRNAVQKLDNSLKFINDCLVGNFAANYQNKKEVFLAFLDKSRIEKIMVAGSDFLRKIHELLNNNDLSLIYLLEEHLESGTFKDEYSQQFHQLILLMKLKAAYNPNSVIATHLQLDASLAEMEKEIEKQRLQAIIKGNKPLAQALNYLAIGCQLTTVKTSALQGAIREHGTKMQAYKHNNKCRELGGRVVLHCNQAMIPGVGLENGFCYGLSYHWAEQLIKNDSFMGFRGNHEAFIQPTKADAKILQAIPSFNDFVRVDPEIFKKQEDQDVKRKHAHDVKIGTETTQAFQQFSDRVLQEADKDCNSAVFSAYFTDSGAHVVAIRKRNKLTPQGFLIDYFDANSGWMQFKSEQSFKTFFLYYLNDRNHIEKINRLAYDINVFPCAYNQMLEQLSEGTPLPPHKRTNVFPPYVEAPSQKQPPEKRSVDTIENVEKMQITRSRRFSF